MKEHPWRLSSLISWSIIHEFFIKWNRNAKTTQIKANDRGTKTKNAENLKPTGKYPKLAEKSTEIVEKLENSSKNLNSHWNLTQIIAFKCFKKEFLKIQTFQKGCDRRNVRDFRTFLSESPNVRESSMTSLLKSLDFRKFFLKAFEGDYLSEISVRIGVFGWVFEFLGDFHTFSGELGAFYNSKIIINFKFKFK